MIREAKTLEDIKKALRLRWEVQLKPQGIKFEEVKNHDLNDSPIILIYEDSQKIIASATAFVLKKGVSMLLHLAVLPEHRGKGIGAKMVQRMEDLLKAKGVKKNSIRARNYLKNFYSDLGYKSSGKIIEVPEFVAKRIFHHEMIKEF